MGLFRRKQPKTTVTVHSEVVDASGMAGLGEEIMETLQEHGIEPGETRVIDASTVPGLTEEIMGALTESGVLEAALGAVAGAGEDDRVSELERLAELHESGALSDYEFAAAKAKILDGRWQ